MIKAWIDSPPADYRCLPVGDGYAYIHKTAKIGTRLKIGRFSYVNENSVISGKYPVQIGAFCSVSSDLYCWTYESHQTEYVSTWPLKTILGLNISYSEVVEKPEGVTIGNDVWIGHQVRLMPGVTIGNGVVVAARAVVASNLEPYGIYGGIPARLIRKRFSDSVISALQEIKWWDWPLDKIRRNTAFFDLRLRDIQDTEIIHNSIID